MNYDVEQYKVFMRKAGLFDMIANHLVNNLVDYALGIVKIFFDDVPEIQVEGDIGEIPGIKDMIY